MNRQAYALKIENLCIDFDMRKARVRVVNNLNFNVNQGECLGIVGESGCGKSITALAIMRLIPAPPGRISGGRILLRNRNLLELSEGEMQDIRGDEIAMIFQEPMTALNPVLKVGKQIAENIVRHQNKSKSEAMRQALEIMQAVDIPAAEQRLGQYPHELSGGMRQRVMIAMALSCQPSVLIADEPTTALDVTVQAQIFNLLRDIQHKLKAAMILITHDMGVIARVTQRVAVMYAGRKVEEGLVDQIIKTPRHPYTRGLIQSTPHLKKNPGTEREDLPEIPGFVPDLSLLDDLCPFRARCSSAAEICSSQMPAESLVADRHYVTCWMAGSI